MSNQISPASHLIDAWSVLVLRLPSSLVSRKDGVVAIFGNVTLPFFNLCIQEQSLTSKADVVRCLKTARDFGNGAGVPWMFVLEGATAPAGWTDAVTDANLAVALRITEMSTSRLLAPRRQLPELEYRRIDNIATASDLATLNALAYEMPRDMFECLCQIELWKSPCHGYVGYRNGTPVTCAAVLPVQESSYVGFVATHPDHTRQGYAEAVMRQAVGDGIAGFGSSRTSLHATEAGRPVYTAMGYQPVRTFAMISEPHEG